MTIMLYDEIGCCANADYAITAVHTKTLCSVRKQLLQADILSKWFPMAGQQSNGLARLHTACRIHPQSTVQIALPSVSKMSTRFFPITESILNRSFIIFLTQYS